MSYKQLDSIETEQVSLIVVECQCGYHMGIDFSYVDQVRDVVIPCPSCKNKIDTSTLE